MISNGISNARTFPVFLGVKETRRRIDVRRTETSSSITSYYTEPIDASET